ncbi:MAG: hypothetical protein ACJ73E_10140 [Mycobacteriales bacterium]
MPGSLAIVERAYRGAVEKQFFDSLCLAVELHRQLGGLDLLLRGPAVSYALRADPPPALRLGGRVLDTLSDPRADLRRLLDAGVRVWVSGPDLAALGLAGAGRLLAGVRPAPAELAARWPDYRTVFYL